MPALAGQTMSTINAEREQMDKRRRIDQILDPKFTDDLADIDNAALKARCDLCEDVELELSYERRMLQGKIDLLAFEGRRRTGRETRSLIEALPEILAEHGPSGGTEHGLPDRNAPAVTPDLDHPGRRREDRAISADFLAHLVDLDEAELDSTIAEMRAVEQEVSSRRRRVHGALDAVLAEVAVRLRDGRLERGEIDAGA